MRCRKFITTTALPILPDILTGGRWVFVIIALSLSSCELINPEEEIPSYIYIEKIDLSITDSTLQGSGSHKISDAWVYIDDQLIGAFELPATFPVLNEGIHTLKVSAGIKNNGMVATRASYPFYDFYINDSTFTLHRDSVVTAKPVVQYFEDIQFAWIEDFEGAISIDSVATSDVSMMQTTDNALVFQGNASGAVFLDSAKPRFKGMTSEKFNLPLTGAEIYLEMDYKTSATLNLYLRANSASSDIEQLVIQLFPTEDNGKLYWNKIYIELTDFVVQHVTANDFQLVFIADLSLDSTSSGEVYFDNLKLIHQ